MIILVTWVALIAAGVSASNYCCEGGTHIVKGGECADGTNASISCPARVMIDPNADPSENYTIDGDSVLVFNDERFPKGMYCLMTSPETNAEVAVLCIDSENTDEREISWTIRAIFASVSIVCLILTIIVYALVPVLRDLQGKCILSSISGLAISFLFLTIMQQNSLPDTACTTFAFITYFSFLVSFFWLNIISFNIWKTVVDPKPLKIINNWFPLYCVYGYGMPTILLITTLVTHHVPGNHIQPGIGKEMCWFQDRASSWAYFYSPISILLVINIILFSWTVKVLWGNYKQTDPKCRGLKYKCLLYMKLFIIMGLTWIFEVLSFAFENTKNFMYYVWAITDYINALQGVLIFLILVILRKLALRGLAERGICCLRFPKKWITLHDEECEELDEDVETKLAQGNAFS